MTINPKILCILTLLLSGLLTSNSWATSTTIRYIEETALLPINKPTGIISTDTSSFAPITGQSINIVITLPHHVAKASLIINSPDKKAIREIPITSLAFGQQTIVWDGKDADGVIVPNEAYTPMLAIKLESGDLLIDDPIRYSGGEVIENIDWNHQPKMGISVALEKPSRLLVRAGIKKGPMLRALSHWQPYDAGNVNIRWNGYDKDQVEYFAGKPNLWLLVMAYQLPKYSIITTGNQKLSYRNYRISKNRPKPIKPHELTLHRNGKTLEKDFFMPRRFQPEINTRLVVEKKPRTIGGIPVITNSLKVNVSVPKADRWVLESSLYEVSFYIDNEFIEEEEQGFVPMEWQTDVSSMASGRHILTTQITGFGGFVVSDTIEFIIDKTNK